MIDDSAVARCLSLCGGACFEKSPRQALLPEDPDWLGVVDDGMSERLAEDCIGHREGLRPTRACWVRGANKKNFFQCWILLYGQETFCVTDEFLNITQHFPPRKRYPIQRIKRKLRHGSIFKCYVVVKQVDPSSHHRLNINDFSS